MRYEAMSMITRREWLKWGSGLALAAACGPATGAGPYRFIDLTPQFRELLGEASSGPAAVQAFKQRIVAPNQRAYGLIERIDDRQLAGYITGAAGSREALAHLSDTFPARFHALWQRFDATLPISGRHTRVYLLPAPEDALGGSVRFDGRDHYVLLGAEVMPYLEKAGVAGDAFIHHELTHLHHQQQNPEIRDAARAYFAGRPGARLYQLLWLEGLAVYVSQRLNPAATEFDLLRSRELGGQVAGSWATLKGVLKAALDSTDHDLIRRLVFDGDEAQKLPAKAGYYVGYRLAQKLGETMPLSTLARWQRRELRGVLGAALESLEISAT